jgi:ATP synthase protein I
MSLVAFCAGAALPALRTRALPAAAARTATVRRRAAPRCGSLEESKKRARSPYDNIPDINQLYLRELSRVPSRQPRATPGEARPAGSILRPDGVLAPGSRRRRQLRRRLSAPAVPESAPCEADREAAHGASLAAYQTLRATLLADTAFVGALAVAAGWAAGSVNTAASVGLGCVGSLAYVSLLARGVDRLGDAGDALAPARAAVLALLVVFSAKHRDVLQVLPVMLGFFTYKVATLLPLVTGEGFEDAA